MSKFNTSTQTRRQVSGPIKLQGVKPSRGVPRSTTHEGATADLLEAKGELFTLAVTNMVSQDTFYESAGQRDERYAKLVREVTETDPLWVARMLVWLRSEANMRTASLVGAAEYVKAGGRKGRHLVASVLQRADEPGELLAYWTAKYGRQVPQPIKRGIADAIARGLYDEYSIQKYDSANRAFRFADVIQLTHPKPSNPTQDALFKYALDRRYQGTDAVPGQGLEMLANSIDLDATVRRVGVAGLENPELALKLAGWTWERLSSYGSFTKETWEVIIPSMGYMALLRNLRNFEQAGVREPTMRKVRDILRDPERVAKSRQLPYRFYSAYREVENDKTKAALEEALEHSFQNIELPGRSLVLIDVSGSMQGFWGRERSKISPADIASVMGVATAFGTDADIVAFGTSSRRLSFRKGGSVLNKAAKIPGMGYEVGHGTNISGAIRTHYDGHDRVLVFTDMQSADNGGVNAPTYLFDLNGYGRVPHLGKNTVVFGGWNDAFLKAIPLIEAGRNAAWPWE